MVLTELQLEETKKAEEAAKSRPLNEQPYGGQPPNYFVVRKGVRYAEGGGVISINPGDLINDRSHNVDDLRAKGAELAPTVAPTLANQG